MALRQIVKELEAFEVCGTLLITKNVPSTLKASSSFAICLRAMGQLGDESYFYRESIRVILIDFESTHHC